MIVWVSECNKSAPNNSVITNPKPPAAWKWLTSANPLGYTFAKSGITLDISAKSDQSIIMPDARAIAIKWINKLVDPPVAINPTIPFT